jgi:TolB-like protein
MVASIEMRVLNHLRTCLFFILSSLATFSQYAQNAEHGDVKPDLVNRHVLILDFTNIQKNEGTSYLGVSVPEAMIDPLKATQKFEVLPRDRADAIMLKLQIDKTNPISETMATQIGIEAGADVVVIGSFTTVSNVVQLSAKAVEVQTGRIAVAKSKQGKLDVTIFTLIGDLSNEMSADMTRELPPLSARERVVVKGFSGRIFSDLRTHVQVITALPQLVPGDYLKPTLGAHIDGSFVFVLPYLQPYAELSYVTAAGKKRVTDMSMIHFAAGITYAWQFSGWGFIREIAVSPYLAGGFYTGKINLQYGYVSDAVNYTVGALNTGMHVDFFLTRHIAATVGISAAFLYDEQTPLIMPGFNVGAGYKF